MTNDFDILTKVENYATQLLNQDIPSEYTYHNYKHTHEIVQYVIEIGQGLKLSSEDLEILQIAAWFHDCGFTKSYENHEEASFEIATNFLTDNNYPEDKLKEVQACILVTKIGSKPKNILQNVMCDADLLNLSKKKFWKRSKTLRKEWETVFNQEVSDLEWYQNTYDFLESHPILTKYVQEEYGQKREKNLQKLETIITNLKLGKSVKDKTKKGKKGSATKKEQKFGRGVETMFRTTSRNHIQLSAIADNKANIMLSINAIIISIIVSVLVPRFRTDQYLILPTLVLLIVCVSTIIFATISTRPKINNGRFTRDDIKNKSTNLLFFGNFHGMPLEEFEWGFNEMMNDQQYLYGSMTRDLYFLGKVLNRKYKFLRLCYNVFMYGLVISVISFIVAYQIFESK